MEGLRGRLCTGYYHTRQLVTADRAVPSTLQVCASATAAKEGGARPIVAGQLQTYIELIDSLQGARQTCALTPATSLRQLRELQQAAVSIQASTLSETALVDVLESVYTAADNKEVTVLIGLDLPAAFDTVCHSTLTQRLQTEFGVSGTAISWIQSYLHGRTQYVKMGQHRSSEATLEVGVPQGSVLGPLLFAVYTAARWPTSSRLTASDTTSTPTTHSFT